VTGRRIREFMMVGTGREFDACIWRSYVGTVFDRQYVWHIFEKGDA
jgi:hypothetical protein